MKNSSNSINSENYSCDKIKNLQKNTDFEIKKFDRISINKLNNQIKNELIFINDKIKVINNNKESLIILCKIDYDTDILEKEVINNKINYLANTIEGDFVNQKKIEYNFTEYE